MLAMLTISAVAGNYVKVTSATDFVNGAKYLIVCEDQNVAFNGALETLDAVEDFVSVKINDGTITTEDDGAVFEINGNAIKSASGFYIGQTSDANGLKQSKSSDYTNTISFDEDGNADIVCSNAHLRFNAASNQMRFRYFKSSSYTGQKAIQLYMLEGSAPAATVAAPTFTPATQEFEESIDVTLTAEEGATIYYNFDNGENWNEYTQAINLTETTTIYAYAVKDNVESTVVSATYTLKVAALEVESLEIAADMEDGVEFVFTGDAVVTYQYKQYLYVRDDTGYGLIYGSTNGGKNPVFAQGTILAPNWEAKTSIYNDELMEFVNTTGLDSCGLTTVAPEVITADQMADKLNAYVQIDHVKSISGTTATLTDGTTINLYNRFGKTIQEFSDADAIITGIVNIYNGNLQLYYIGVEGIVAAPEIAPASCDFEESVEVTITAEEGATIKYSYDNETWADYTEALTITETTTVYAKAVVGTKESNVVSATYTKVDPAEMVTYTLVTDASQLANGDKIILVGYVQVDSVTVQPYAMGDFKTNNFGSVIVDVEDNTVTTALAHVLTLEANGDNWNFKANDGRYLYADGSDYIDNQGKTKSQNYLKLQDEVNAYATAAISMANDTTVIEFQGDNDSKFMRFNPNKNSSGYNPLFSCYKETSSVKNPVYIFKAGTTEPAGLRGDVNNDKNVTIADVTALIDYLLSGSAEGINTQNANCNLDEGITIADVTVLIDYLLSGNW